MSEKSILNKLQLLASKHGHRLWRNSVGQAYAGKYKGRLPNGDIIVGNATAIKYGLGVGTGDLLGATRVKITHDMVGQEILIFTNIEVKCSTTKTSAAQLAFHKYVISNGGISYIEKINNADESEFIQLASGDPATFFTKK